ncbi:MAG TPA: HEAT repeat domain-containing protein, partial [Pyrinomonadaceae bacterium]|nr:HEAT repeat domain-containing protein [Pyrinomonadaceae bacterium]
MTSDKKQKGPDETSSGSFVVPVTPFLLLLFLFFACLATNAPAQDLRPIQSAIASGNVELTRNALFQIKNLHTEAASRLAVPALNSPNEIVRATAANSVIFLPKNEATQALTPLLADKAEFVRTETAFALGEVRDPSAVTPLTQTLEHDNSRVVKAAAATALGKIGDPAAVEPLGKIFQSHPNEENEFLRRCAAHALGKIAEWQLKHKPTTTTPENFLPDKYKNDYLVGTQPDRPTLSQLPTFRTA